MAYILIDLKSIKREFLSNFLSAAGCETKSLQRLWYQNGPGDHSLSKKSRWNASNRMGYIFIDLISIKRKFFEQLPERGWLRRKIASKTTVSKWARRPYAKRCTPFISSLLIVIYFILSRMLSTMFHLISTTRAWETMKLWACPVLLQNSRARIKDSSTTSLKDLPHVWHNNCSSYRSDPCDPLSDNLRIMCSLPICHSYRVMIDAASFRLNRIWLRNLEIVLYCSSSAKLNTISHNRVPLQRI